MKINKNIYKLTTLLLGINLIFPTFVLADNRTGQGTESVQAGVLQLSNVPQNFNFPTVTINDFVTNESAYANGFTSGEAATVNDQRFEGGYELQVSATNYIGQGNPSNVINISKLGILTQSASVPSGDYIETSNLTNEYNNSEGTLIPSSQGFSNTVNITIPFQFSLYGATSNSLYICTRGYISVGTDPNACGGGSPVVGSYGIIDPYYSNHFMTGTFGSFDVNNGIYYNEVSSNEVHIRFKGNIEEFGFNNVGSVEYTVFLFSNGNIEFHFGPVTDTTQGPGTGISTGLYNAGTSTFIESDVLGNLADGSAFANQEVRFSPSSVTSEGISKPGTPAVYAPTNSTNTTNQNSYTFFTEDIGNPGFSLPITLLEGQACNTTTVKHGRLQSDTVYPFFMLLVEPSVLGDTYQNTITYTLLDKTITDDLSSFCQP